MKNISINSHFIWAILLCCFTCFTYADTDIKGFGTFGAAFTTGDKTSGPYDDRPNYHEDSLAAVQLDTDLSDGLSATVQVIAEGSEDWEARVEWAYLNYEVNDHVRLLFGRQRSPFFLYSDYIDVSYAYHWIKPPEGVYSFPVESTTGIGALIENNIGPINWRLHLQAGSFERYTETSKVIGNNQWFTALDLEWNWLTVRAITSGTNITIESDGLRGVAAGWRAAGYEDIASRMTLDDGDGKASFSGLAMNADFRSFFVTAEIMDRDTKNTIFTLLNRYYVSSGFRVGKFTPHITYSKVDDDAQSTDFLNSVPFGQSDSLNGLIGATRGIYRGPVERYHFYQLGLRWDYHPSAAFKAEIKSLKNDIGDSETVNLLRFAVVAVF